jgi:phage tail-like protein
VPGRSKYSNITLKWGVTVDTELFDWHMQWVKGDPDVKRKNGSIVMLDRQGNEKLRFNFVNGWPAKWTGPSFNAKGSDVAIQTLEIAHEGLEKAS